LLGLKLGVLGLELIEKVTHLGAVIGSSEKGHGRRGLKDE
jgi:hypothetical protein